MTPAAPQARRGAGPPRGSACPAPAPCRRQARVAAGADGRGGGRRRPCWARACRGDWPGSRPPLPARLAALPGGPAERAAIGAMAGAAWLAWAVFAAALAAEACAAARGRTVRRLPAVGPVQALAAALAGAAVVTALHLPKAAWRASQPLHAALTAAVSAAGPAGPRAYTVAEGDDLWDLAGRFLGNAADWPQIFRLNQGRPQPGGARPHRPRPDPAGLGAADPPARPGTRRPAPRQRHGPGARRRPPRQPAALARGAVPALPAGLAARHGAPGAGRGAAAVRRPDRGRHRGRGRRRARPGRRPAAAPLPPQPRPAR